MRAPKLELLWWEGCPSTERALTELRAAAAELGLESPEIALREIRTDEEAAATGFIGSPTILVDGIDVVADDSRPETTGLTCRVYRRRDGRISPTPDPDDLRAALAAADHAEPVARCLLDDGAHGKHPPWPSRLRLAVDAKDRVAAIGSRERPEAPRTGRSSSGRAATAPSIRWSEMVIRAADGIGRERIRAPWWSDPEPYPLAARLRECSNFCPCGS